MNCGKSIRYKTVMRAPGLNPGVTRASTWIRLEIRQWKDVDGRVKHGHDDL
jgi:hypothetical protein